MSIVNSLLKRRVLLPFCFALAFAGIPFSIGGNAWLDGLGIAQAKADDDRDDRFDDDDDDRYDDDRYDDDRYDDDDDDDDRYGD